MNKEMVAVELVTAASDIMAMDFPTQDIMDKYLKKHPAADKSKHKVVESPNEIQKKIDETPDQVEERLKKQQGDKYKTQEQRTKEEKEKGDKKNPEAPAKAEPAEKPEEETEDFGDQKDYVLTVRKNFSDATGGKKVKDILKQNDEIHNWAAQKSDNYDLTEPVMDSVWKGYLKVDTGSMVKGAMKIVKDGEFAPEDVLTQLELGRARGKAALDLAKEGKGLDGRPMGDDTYVKRKTESNKEWDKVIEGFKKKFPDMGKAPAEVPAEKPAEVPAKPIEKPAETPAKPAEVPADKPEAPAKPAEGESDDKTRSFNKKMDDLEKRISEQSKNGEGMTPWRGLDRVQTKELTDAIKTLGEDDEDVQRMEETQDPYKDAWKTYNFDEETNAAAEKAYGDYLSAVKKVVDKAKSGGKPEDKPEAPADKKEEPKAEPNVEKPDHPDMPLGNHAKAKVNSKTLAKVKKVMDASGLKGEEDELQELAGFKKTLGQRVPEKDVGKYYVRNAQKLKKDFLANMDPSNYKDPEAFANAKKRMQAMPVEDFAKVLAAINDEDEAITGSTMSKEVIANELLAIAKGLIE